MKKSLFGILLLTVFLVLRGNFVFATHLVGGEISVAYAGSPNLFNVTVTIYRDKTGYGFENSIEVGVYDRLTNAWNQTITLSNPTITTLNLGNGCYTPVLQIERAVYVYNNVNIPNNPNGYYLSYLRCCRNDGITNLANPGNEGWLAICEIPDPALGNSSPTFNTYPRAFMCQNVLNTITDFQATDVNGDVLVYKFETPFSCSATGQCGPFGSSGYGSPIPGAQPGPYGFVTWQTGYSTANPIGDPGMTINSSTGVITCTPPATGRYVFNVTVEEWRGTVKLGEIRRDFQFEVLNNCTQASIAANPGNPICSGATATLTANGVPAGFTYSWNPGGQATSSITITPSTPGTYNYTVSATNGLGCTYTANIALVVNPTPTISITNTGNICLGQNQTLTASGGSTYSWNNGVGGAVLTGVPAGTYTVWGTNTSNCTATATATISAPVTASTYTWTGNGSNTPNNWFDGTNWSSGCVPNCTKDVVIPNTGQAIANPPRIGTTSGPASCNEIFIASGSSLIFSNATSQLDVCGDFINNGTITSTAGVIKFQGSVPQNFTQTSTGDLYNVILANTASPPRLTIKEGVNHKDLSIASNGSFTFQSGLIYTEGGRKLTIKNTASNALGGHNPNAYVYGRLNRAVAAGSAYDFPVGSEPIVGNAFPYQLMNINFISLGGLTDLTVSFENPINATGTGLPVNETSAIGQYTDLLNNGGNNTGVGYPGGIGGVWTVIPNSYTTTPNYDITLYGRNYDNSGSYEHSVLKRNTFCPGVWTVDGSYHSSSVAGNVVTAHRTGLTGFSQFAIAKTILPLPVQLVLFDAACMGQQTILSWVTASETNNDYFTLEKSCNENISSYETIAIVDGAGNSATIRKYSYTDSQENAGECYYRLSQTDFDGTTTVFAPVAINCNENSSFNFVGILPNPAQDEVAVLFTSDNIDAVTLHITDIFGKQLLEKEIIPETGLNKTVISLSDIATGIYFMKLTNRKKVFVKKVVKKE